MDYWPIFESFVAAELEAHGPDHQLQLLLSLEPEVTEIEKVWLIGCYCAHHCVASAYAVWREFRPEEVVNNPDRLLQWLIKNWYYLPVRPEMHSHRVPEKRWDCLVDFALYSIGQSWRTGSYEAKWEEAIESVRFFDRYLGIKYLEMLRRSVRPDLRLNDIRAKAGWSPRTMIALLYPEVAHIIGDKKNNTLDAVFLTEEYATKIKDRLFENEIDLSYYQLQVLLCNGKQMITGRLAPGSGHDAELNFVKIASKGFDLSHIVQTRAKIFNPKYLQESSSWQGHQKEIWRKKVKEL